MVAGTADGAIARLTAEPGKGDLVCRDHDLNAAENWDGKHGMLVAERLLANRPAIGRLVVHSTNYNEDDDMFRRLKARLVVCRAAAFRAGVYGLAEFGQVLNGVLLGPGAASHAFKFRNCSPVLVQRSAWGVMRRVRVARWAMHRHGSPFRSAEFVA